MKKKLLRYAAPIALTIGLTGGLAAVGTAGASTSNGKTHHAHHHQSPKPKPHHKKNK